MPPSRVTAIFLFPRATLSPSSSTYRSISTQPLRPQLHPRQQQQQFTKQTISFFSTSNPTWAREPNFYEILDVPTTASAAEIKKQFYALSMRHHPDRNRTDPDASQRFARISAAYNVLGNDAKRAVYDRDHGFHTTHHASSHSHQHPMGSHSSYAGSRPASGLSKRRTAFHGPPPSFYEQGGYGATGRQAQGRAPGGSGGGASEFGAGAGAGAGAKQADPEDWEGFIRRNPLHHFNAQSHFRTQAAEDRRRRDRRQGARRIDEDRVDPRVDQTVSRFFLCSGCLIVMLVVVDFWRSVPSAVDGRKPRKQKGALSS